MTGDSITPEPAPPEALSAPQSDEPPVVGPSRASRGGSGLHAGAQRLDCPQSAAGCRHPAPTCQHGCRAAADELTRLGQDMEAPMPEPTPVHSCDNCDGVDPGSCLANPARPAPVPPPAGVREETIRALSRVLLDSGGRLVPKHIAETARAVQESADAVLRVPAIAEALMAVAAVERVREWSDGPCPTRPAPFEITGDRARGYVQAMDEIAQLLAGHGPLALDPQEQP